MSINLFFDELGGHGDWVNYRDRYVFVPTGVDRDWRPYTLGHWIYADDYGWTWDSDEAFGWATYHYGRWGHDDEIGWYWVPGTRWAPAWVSWRRSADYVIWAPLPPADDDGVSVSISFGSIPSSYWVAVPTRSFLDIDLRARIVFDDRERVQIVDRSEELGTVRVRGDRVVNTGIDVNHIQRETGKDVRRVRVGQADDPRQARVTDDQVTAYRGTIEPDANAKPARVKKAADVRRERGQKEGPAADELTTGSTSPAAADETTTVKPRKGQQQVEQPADEAQGQAKPRKRQQQQVEQPANEGQGQAKARKRQQQQVEQPADEGQGQAKARKRQQQQVEQPADEGQGQAKARKRQQQQAEQPVEQGQANANRKQRQPRAEQPVEQGQGNANRKPRQNQACDPAVDATCQPQ